MQFIHIEKENFEELAQLHRAYKSAIGEEIPTEKEEKNLFSAIANGQIQFYGCVMENKLAGCCSVSRIFSTFHYQKSGVLEDFYLLPEYRHQRIARKLIQYAVAESGVKSLTVGCADCDVEMYRALGFTIRLGNMLAFDLE